jgi:ketosteroid isomerase-like protein
MPTPQEILEQSHALFIKRDADGIADLMAEDVVVENPFAPARLPDRIEGREKFRRHLTERLASTPVELHAFDSVVVHETTDPDVIITEFTLRGRIPSSGHEFSRQYIQVMRVRDGKVVLWRDYFNPLGLEQLLRA